METDLNWTQILTEEEEEETNMADLNLNSLNLFLCYSVKTL